MRHLMSREKLFWEKHEAVQQNSTYLQNFFKSIKNGCHENITLYRLKAIF